MKRGSWEDQDIPEVSAGNGSDEKVIGLIPNSLDRVYSRQAMIQRNTRCHNGYTLTVVSFGSIVWVRVAHIPDCYEVTSEPPVLYFFILTSAEFRLGFGEITLETIKV